LERMFREFVNKPGFRRTNLHLDEHREAKRD
jgi:hypothetical protein